MTEPPGEGPLPQLRVSDVERELVIGTLREHCALGRLTLDEFTERMQTALAARTRADLDVLTTDLPQDEEVVREMLPQRRPRKARRWTVAFMSGTARKRRWRLAGQTTAVAFMGGVKLDLREAEVEGPDATIVAVAFMGAVEIIVPEGMDVELDGFAFMGGKDLKVRGDPVKGMPSLTVHAFSFMGGVSVRSKPRLTP